ncbi:DUF1302 domain-containing protein [Pseudomonas sp. BGr12]|uniref:DUF1302 domain-containing protein n=1 Tax=Pseudomonas sp. BGr12 TaxID=2936269 RepID=UPI00255A1628|nr:DUF1302 domain-containing protein [Pseudomonas sp. BJa5]MDL2426294.1 DUF1302 domain-containing protein [Pseudomonas sp. BJa5]
MKKLTTALCALGAVCAVPHTSAFQIVDNPDGVTASLDSVVEYNVIYRTSKVNRPYSGGENVFANDNDGSEYYNRGIVSNEYKIRSELDLKYGDDGIFVRGAAWYDTAIMDRGPSGSDFDTHNTDSASKFPSDLKNRVGHKARLLDAYWYVNSEVGEHPLSFRLGRQVINWGEGLFYADGLNVSNPLDLGRVVLPSASYKDALLPVNMFSAQFGLTENLSVDGYYALEWRRNEIVPTGAFLSDNDIFGKGTNGVLVDMRGTLAELGIPESLVPGLNGVDGLVTGARYGKDTSARDSGQYGLALRYVAPELNSTEFGLYYMNYHSKTPFMSVRPGQTGSCSVSGSGGRYGSLCGLGIAGLDEFVDGLAMLDSTYYDLVYPEDIRVFGFTVSGNVHDTNVGFEVTYRPNMPIESGMTSELESYITGALSGGASGGTINLGDFGDVNGHSIDLYHRDELYTTSLTTISTFGPRIGLDDVSLLTEIATNYIPGSITDSPNYAYLSPFSWGFTASLSGTYQSFLPGIDLYPALTFAQSVKGTSPALSSNFSEGRKSGTAELGARYGDSLYARISYTNFWGKRKENTLGDRDHLALSVSYSF